MASLFAMDIQMLKGVGEKRAALFRKVGAPTVGELLRLYPRTYEDWSSPVAIGEAPLNEISVIRATVLARPRQQYIRKGMTLYKTEVTDGVRDMTLTYFNNPYVQSMLQEGKEYLFRGKMQGNLTRREMTAPDFSPADGSAPIVPVYPQTEGLSSRQIGNAMKAAFQLLPELLRDPLPDEMRQRLELCQLRFAMENIHFPGSMELLEIARRRLVFEELLVLQLGLLSLKSRTRVENHLRLTQDVSEEFYRLLPFTPTNAQKRAIAEALTDMQGEAPMSRLIQGDVGSGKTAVAAALCYCVIREGMQAALMAPTEVLARQHAKTLSAMLEPAGIRTALLVGSMTAKQKRTVTQELASGEIQLIIGTHALLTEGVVFQKLALVVTDEQHRFGVAQRAALAQKGENPHLLVMSATPIPRTLALMIFGDLDISILDELPPGRQKIETFAITSDKRERAFGYVKKHLDRGLQGYMICPLIEEGQSDMASVTQYRDMLEEGAFSGYRIGILHGRMKPREKDAVMAQFSSGELDLLVSTTVVEVGVDVPNAVIIVIENAERYGLSQLHQLRGRVGRGHEKSTCILISDAQNEEAVTRLRVMCSTSDGFRIADEDLKLRGPGDFFGSRQHGLPQLSIADMAQDITLLKLAQEEARHLLHEDPDLEQPEHRGLRAETRRLFEKVGDGAFT
ncbi:MAG TPA: ATP-dependent DNA helicase RecG [Candidatus Gallacutalibacter pullistercoris]|nr:ATP-dependent DNA helicase RecG [Candidatus Gallacutalibacter pullistercoris]